MPRILTQPTRKHAHRGNPKKIAAPAAGDPEPKTAKAPLLDDPAMINRLQMQLSRVGLHFENACPERAAADLGKRMHEST